MAANRYSMGELAPANPSWGSAPKKKKRWLRSLLIVFALMSLSVGGCVAFGYHSLRARQAETLAADSTLVMPLQGELPLSSPSGIEGLLDPGSSTSVDAVRRALAKAANDPQISSVVVVLDGVQNGLGTIEALRELFHDFRQSEKPLRALIETDTVHEADLYLASAASQVLLSPHTMVSFDGMAADVSFFGESLDMLGVKPEVIQFKEYKSAFEPWMGREMSEPMKRSIQALLASSWKNLLEGIAKDRKLEVSTLRTFAQRGLGTAQDAVDVGLADKLGYRDALFAQASGERVSISRYLRPNRWSLGDDVPQGEEGTKVALLAASGNIVVDAQSPLWPDAMISGRKLAAQIRKAAKDEDISAILLWVDSPGGSMVGSDLVWREVQRARTEHGKPVVVSMASVAASGGYWISMGADAIVAAPSTITGSIGVIFGRLSMKDFLNRLGVHHDVVLEGGEHANLGSIWDPLSPAQRSLLEGILGQSYAQFVQKVAQGRDRRVEDIEAVAKGRVWTGRDALEHGLIDRLGGVLTAVSICKEKLDLRQDAPVHLQLYSGQSVWEQLWGTDQAASVLSGVLAGRAQGVARVLEAMDREVRQAATPRAWVWAPKLRLR